jgi:hypothetical protein
MKNKFAVAALLLLFATKVMAQKGLTFQERPDQKKIELLYNGKLLTAYCYFDSTEKPVLFPVRTLSGVTVTRGFPVAPRGGERTDHPHHVGIWFNYESVNGLDFWNNSDAISAEKKPLYGSVRHQKIISSSAAKQRAQLKTLSHWVDHTGKILLEEVAEFNFKVEGNNFIIDRTSTLTAKVEEVFFKDVKDGMIAIRVARELEMPSKQEDKFVDVHGHVTTVPQTNNDGVTGMYVNREGIRGDDAWGKRSAWTYLTGKREGENITIAMIDHPSNIGYPTYWHARGYGLFAANPLGQKIFSNGKEELNFKLSNGKSVTFKYRIVIHHGDNLSSDTMDKLMQDFGTPKP